jgi:hypothetical protein
MLSVWLVAPGKELRVEESFLSLAGIEPRFTKRPSTPTPLRGLGKETFTSYQSSLPGVIRLGHDTNCSLLSRAEIKTRWS